MVVFTKIYYGHYLKVIYHPFGIQLALEKHELPQKYIANNQMHTPVISFFYTKQLFFNTGWNFKILIKYKNKNYVLFQDLFVR